MGGCAAEGGGGRPASATGTPFVGGGGALAADALTTRCASMNEAGGGFTPPKEQPSCGMKPFGGDFQSGCSDGGCVDAVGGAGGPSRRSESGDPSGLGQREALAKILATRCGGGFGTAGGGGCAPGYALDATGGLSPLSISRVYIA